MNDIDRVNLVRVLADFASWLEPRPGMHADMAYYRQLASHFIETGGLRDVVDIPTSAHAWCDLCGQGFWRPPDHRPEMLTGRNYSWCPACSSQQYYAMTVVGPEVYRAAWQAEEKAADAHERRT